MCKFYFLLFCGVAAFSLVVNAKDFGVLGATFKIKELSLLEVIQHRLQTLQKTGKIEAHQQELQKRVRNSIENPQLLAHIKTATTYQSRLYDPSILIEEDIKDHKGEIVVPQGKIVNPLDYHSFGRPLVFIQGDKPNQVFWALREEGKVVLVSGKPLYLAKAYTRAFYFDQGGILTRKFSIKTVPARVSQKGKKLLIEEFALKEGKR
jgi:conjugal transfer pilus assembly protein TraW